jgi:hypothetical protein
VDPLVDATGQPYAYTGDDPVNDTDPSGLDTFGECIGAQLNAGLTYYSATVCIVRTDNDKQVAVTVTSSNPLLSGASTDLKKVIDTANLKNLFGGGANFELQNSNASNVCELGGNFNVTNISIGNGLIGFSYQHAGDAAGTSVYTYGAGYDRGLGVSGGNEYTAVTVETGAAAQAINKLFGIQESSGLPIMPIIA